MRGPLLCLSCSASPLPTPLLDKRGEAVDFEKCAINSMLVANINHGHACTFNHTATVGLDDSSYACDKANPSRCPVMEVVGLLRRLLAL